MREVRPSGPPPAPPGGGFRRHRRRGGFWGNFAKAGIGLQLNIILSIVGLLLIVGYLVWRFIIPHGSDVAEASTPPPTEPPIKIKTVAPLEDQSPATSTPPAIPADTPAVLPEPDQIAATATAHHIYSRPALADPEASPYLIGVITYEPGCQVSNLGFTTAGVEGRPYYLYFQQPMDRDPLMQMAQVQGYIQRFDDCQHPVLMVSQIVWLNDIGTPAPLGANFQPITGTVSITGTPTVTGTLAAWGSLPTPNKQHTPVYRPTPYPTYTPPPSATPYVPPPPQVTIIYVDNDNDNDDDDDPDPTNTPLPTSTATPTATCTPTPIVVSIYGDVVTVVGCPYTNLAVSDGQDTYFIEMAGAQLPTGNPADYHGMVSGQAATICDGPSIKANQIVWYLPTATPTSTPTLIPTPTTEPTAEPTQEPTTEPTQEPTVEPTQETAVEPTAEL